MPSAGSEIAVAVLAQSDVAIRRIAETLERDGLPIKLSFAGLTEMSLDMLATPPDVAIIEAGVPGFDAHAAVRRARTALPHGGIVVICGPGPSSGLPQLLEEGADGIVLASDLQMTLPPAVRAACARQLSVPRQLRHLVSPPALTHREKEVLWLATGGLTNGEIAARLYLAESTVKTHLSSAFRRLGVTSRRQAAALVLASDESLRRQLSPAAALKRETPTPLVEGQAV